MSMRWILFKGVVLVALGLSLVPMPVLASTPFEPWPTATDFGLAAGAPTGFADQRVRLPWQGSPVSGATVLFLSDTDAPGRNEGVQRAAAFPTVAGISAGDQTITANAVLQPMQQHVLTVTKTVEWSGVSLDTEQQFTICVEGPSYPLGNCQAVDYLGGELVWGGLDSGVYTVTESYPGDEWDVAIAGSPVTFIDEGDATATVVNTRKLGSLAVTKTVDWNGVTPEPGQQFTICVQGPSHPGGDCQIAGYTGDTLSWNDLIPGDYTVTENDPGDEWDVTITGSPAAVPEDGGEGTAVVTNARLLGGLRVAKVVEWNGVTPDLDQRYIICIQGPSYPVRTCRGYGPNGGTVLWPDLIPGDYTVTENDPGDEWDVAIAGSPAAVPEDGGIIVSTVTNARRLGSLVVTKEVNWNGATPDLRQHFTICIEGPSHPSGDCQTVSYTGGTLSWDDLIPGDYTITEVDPGDEWDVTIVGSPAAVPEDGGSVDATVTNTRRLGSLSVTKMVEWDDIAPDVSQQFTICIEGPTHPTGDCQTIGYLGGTLYWDDLIPGDYTVTEVDPGDEWFVEVTGSPAAVPADGGSASAVVTNTHQLGWVKVTKVVDWGLGRPDASRQFTICITGPSYPGGDCRTVGHTGGILSWDELIPGDYVVTESDPGDSWEVEIEGSPATVPDDGTGVGVSISNYYGGSTIYLPLVTRSFVASAPDLVVDNILVTSDSAQVVIKNQGDGPVLPVNAFWVDLYVDPDPIPTAVNQTWDYLCDQGIVWGVTAPALPLEPGGTLTLTIGDDYHSENYSYFPGALPPGTPIYVQVDSADVQTTHGAVLEIHEIMGDPYNNIAGPVPSTGGVAGAVQRDNPRTVLRDRSRHLTRDLPSRP